MIRFRNRFLIASDALLTIGCVVIAFTARFDGWNLSPDHLLAAKAYLVVTVPLRIIVFYFSGLYRQLWRHASLAELEFLVGGAAISAAACAITGVIILPTLGIIPVRVPLSVVLIDGLLTAFVVGATRLGIRVVGRKDRRRSMAGGKRVLIVGAGHAAQLAARELLSNPQLSLSPIGFVDDDASKHDRTLVGLPIFGAISAIPAVASAHFVDEILIAIPSALAECECSDAHPSGAVRDPERPRGHLPAA